jgi:AhpD family alkylhydroperoxidase
MKTDIISVSNYTLQVTIDTTEDMMLVNEKKVNEYPVFIRPFFWRQKKKYGEVLKPGLLWGRSPWLFSTVALLYGALDRRRSPINPVIRSLVTVRVSQINWCEFCVDINSKTLMERAGAQVKVDQLEFWRDSKIYTHEERLAIEYCEVMTYSDLQVTDELAQRLKAVYSEDAIVELTGIIAFQNLSSKFNAALNVPAQGFCKIPAQPPSTNE